MVIKVAHWYLDAETGELSHDNSFASPHHRFDHTPLQLLLCLIKHQGIDVSKETMLAEVWPNKVVTEDVLSVAVSQIRKALGDSARKPSFIKTIPGKGYRLIASVEELTPVPLLAHSCSESVKRVRLKRPHWLLLSVLVMAVIAFVLLNVTPQKSNVSPITNSQLPTQALTNHYQKGRYLLSLDSKQHWQEAQQAFEDTIIQAPDFAPAYRYLAEAKFKLHQQDTLALYKLYQELLFLINKAQTLEPGNAKTALLLANYSFWIGWDFTQAERAYKRGLALDPDNAQLHFYYAQFLLAKKDFASAIVHIKHYIALDPKSYAIPSVAWIYNMMEQFDEALAEVDKINKLDGSHDNKFTYHVSIQGIYEAAGQDEKAGLHLLEILKLSKYNAADMQAAQHTFAQKGLAGLYQWLLDDKKETAWLGQYQPPLAFARYALGAGDVERAVDYLLQAKRQRQTELLWFNIDVKYKALWQHPKLVNFMPLPE